MYSQENLNQLKQFFNTFWGEFRTALNIYDEAFSVNSKLLKTVNYFRKKTIIDVWHDLNNLSANAINWSNTLQQFVG